VIRRMVRDLNLDVQDGELVVFFFGPGGRCCGIGGMTSNFGSIVRYYAVI